MAILAFAMQKGGVGKTTTTAAVGVELARLGKKVLLVDMDPQSNLTQALGIDPTQLKLSVRDVLLNPSHGIDSALIKSEFGPDLLPATLALASAELSLAGVFGRELRLRSALIEQRSRYNYILIDSPPSLGIFTLNALTAADAVIVPVQAHVFALQALPQLEETVAIVRQLNPLIKIGGVVMTMVGRTSINAAVEEAVREQYTDRVFTTVIPNNTKLVEAPAAGQPISVYAPSSAGAQAYHNLTKEVVERYG